MATVAELTKDASDAPSWYFLIVLYDALRAIVWDNSREANVRPMVTDNILVVKSDREKIISHNYSQLPKPCVILTYRECNDREEGVVGHDDVIYRYQAFILDKDYDTGFKGMRTWQKWQYQIMNRLRLATMNDTLEIDGVTDAPLVYVSGFEALEDVKWDTDNVVRGGIMINIPAREVRDGS